MRRLTESPAKLATEVRARQPGAAREVVDPERLGVASVGEILRAEQVPDGGRKGHGSSMAPGTIAGAPLTSRRQAAPRATQALAEPTNGGSGNLSRQRCVDHA